MVSRPRVGTTVVCQNHVYVHLFIAPTRSRPSVGSTAMRGRCALCCCVVQSLLVQCPRYRVNLNGEGSSPRGKRDPGFTPASTFSFSPFSVHVEHIKIDSFCLSPGVSQAMRGVYILLSA